MSWKKCFLLGGMLCGPISAQDKDGDGIPDSWEQANGSHPEVANADADFDRDHVNAKQEHDFGLNPLGVWKATKIPVNALNVPTVLLRINKHGDVAFPERILPPVNGRAWYGKIFHLESNQVTDLPNVGIIYDLNDDNEVVGLTAISPTQGIHYKPWSGSSVYDISQIDNSIPSGISYPYHINNLGEITGRHSSYGPYFQNFLGLIDAYEDDPEAAEIGMGSSLYFNSANDSGTLLGTYSLNNSPMVFLYQQSDPTLPGYFFPTAFPSQFSSLPFGENYNPNDQTPEDIDLESHSFHQLYKSINNYGEFANVFNAEGSVGTDYAGVQYFDGEFSWDLVDPTDTRYATVRAVNDWPQIIFSRQNSNYQFRSTLYHEHTTASPSDLEINDPPSSSGASVYFQPGAQFLTLSNNGHVVVKGRLPSDSVDHYYVLELHQDSDSNGLPDDWELANGVTEPEDDPDGDGLTNYQEFLYNLDPWTEDNIDDSASLGDGSSTAGNDADGDGIPNTVEVLWGMNRTDSSDAKEDIDGDGLSNLAEFLAGTSAISMDTDRDGVSDSEELANGTDPKSTDYDISSPTTGLIILTPLHQ